MRMRGALFVISVAFFLLSAVELDGRREFGDGSLELVSTAGADARDRVDRVSGTRKACGSHGVSGVIKMLTWLDWLVVWLFPIRSLQLQLL